MAKNLGLAAVVAATALTGCIVTPVAYRPAPPPPAPPPPAVVYESTAEVNEPPPPLPVYEQPPCPVEGYIWTPGLWRFGPQGYFWVPGTWVAPPQVGLLWTPGYWGMAGAVFVFHAGYWGPHIGFYGGINYGGGYVGNGYAGGRWVNNNFQYNTAVTNVNVTNVHNTYNQTIVNNVTVVNNTNITQTSYAGGPGTRTRPTAQEAVAVSEPHVQPTLMQNQHESAARANPALAAAHNQGHPPIAATTHAGAFSGPGVTAAKPVGAAWHPNTPAAAVNAASHGPATKPTPGPAVYPAHAPAAAHTPAAPPGQAVAATTAPTHNVQHTAPQGSQPQKPKAAAKTAPKKGEGGKPRPEHEGERPEQRG
jgi:WXXGXW repeat (2 copies)